MKCKNERRDDARKFPKLPILLKKYQSGGNLQGGGKGPLTLGGNILTKEQQRAAGGAGIRKVGADLMGQTEAVHLLAQWPAPVFLGSGQAPGTAFKYTLSGCSHLVLNSCGLRISGFFLVSNSDFP